MATKRFHLKCQSSSSSAVCHPVSQPFSTWWIYRTVICRHSTVNDFRTNMNNLQPHELRNNRLDKKTKQTCNSIDQTKTIILIPDIFSNFSWNSQKGFKVLSLTCWAISESFRRWLRASTASLSSCQRCRRSSMSARNSSDCGWPSSIKSWPTCTTDMMRFSWFSISTCSDCNTNTGRQFTPLTWCDSRGSLSPPAATVTQTQAVSLHHWHDGKSPGFLSPPAATATNTSSLHWWHDGECHGSLSSTVATVTQTQAVSLHHWHDGSLVVFYLHLQQLQHKPRQSVYSIDMMRFSWFSISTCSDCKT